MKKILLSLLLMTIYIHANEVKMIQCEPTQIYKCTLEKCEKYRVVNVDDVQYFEIDLAKKTLIGKIGQDTFDIENIVSRHGNKNTFIFFGTHADSEYDWILRINKKNGKLVIVGADGELNSFTTFGTCKWETEK